MKHPYLTLVATLWPLATEAAEHVVKALNAGKHGPMAFEPALIRLAVGDTVKFEPAEKGGHNSMSKVVPEGAQGWKSGFDEASGKGPGSTVLRQQWFLW